MRDPNRLDSFYDEIKTIHKSKWPDLRFGQLMSNFFDWLYSEFGMDCFFPEEDAMLKYFKEYSKTGDEYDR